MPSCREKGSITILLHALGAAALLAALGPSLLEARKTLKDLTEMSLEDLLRVEVTSVSRREQELSQSPSAVYVITKEDIRRSGATSIPEALRMAPGVHVGQIDANKWAVSIRGFSGRFSSKLLVMIDGRSIYHPSFAGVYWEATDALLEDIERIEVIRGPGATVWGSNAVNGVINIITKDTRSTQGALLSAGGGNQEGGFGAARFGGEINPGLRYRVYSKYFSRSGSLLASGERSPDNWLKLQGGFRSDWQMSESDSLTVTGDAYNADGGDRQSIALLESPYSRISTYRASFSGANVMSRWTHAHSGKSSTQLQAYYAYSTRDDMYLRDTSVRVGDIELQHQVDLARHRVIGGAGFRLNDDANPTDWVARYDPRSRTTNRVSMFVQDEIALAPEKLLLTVGSKFENNTFTDWEVQPSVSLLWNRTARDTVWLSFARAARTPSRVDHDVVYRLFSEPGPGNTTIVADAIGNKLIQSEHLLTYEAGYRFSPTPRLSLDLTVFYNVYSDVQTGMPGEPLQRPELPTVTVIPFLLQNVLNPRLYGGEIAAGWKPIHTMDLRANYSYLRGNLATTSDVLGPGHQFHARWFWSLPREIEWDSSYYFFDHFSGVPAHHRIDTRVGWRLTPHWEFSLTAQNVLDNQHLESVPVLTLPTEVGRSVYGKITWRIDSQ